ncbi:MAG: 3'(2'),5'-bisphosphate nucleotidase CysQ [Deltaproteobacteria bacterium]|nr:3'(2'),5'-bisphosphate nucleotidase CysQ [Deltaproteobacteria bacterium]
MSDCLSNEQIQKICDLACRAGDKILELYADESCHSEFQIKEDQSPVTRADLASHQMIYDGLSAHFPFQVISEEGDLTNCHNMSQHCYWLVDPLDGTKEFIARTDDFCINIALIQDKRPIFGLIYAPISTQLFYAQKGMGSFRRDAKGHELRIFSHQPFDINHFTIVMSRRHGAQLPMAMQAKWPGCQIRKQGSALKFCSVAEGSADLYLRMGRTSLWDTAAGQIILEEAGGKLVDSQGIPLSYSTDSLINGDFWAVGDYSCPHNFIRMLWN